MVLSLAVTSFAQRDSILFEEGHIIDTTEVGELKINVDNLNFFKNNEYESEISKGTVNMSLVSPRELFVEALQKNAVYIILLHNHPSGDPSPSREDILVTKRVQMGGQILGIELLDHIIIGDNCYVSLAEMGILEDT